MRLFDGGGKADGVASRMRGKALGRKWPVSRTAGWRWLAAAVVVTTFTPVGSAQVSAPSLGYTESGGKVYAVEGIPAAARRGAAVEAPQFAQLVTAGELALGVDAATGAVVVIQGGSVQPLSGFDPWPEAIALSPSGTSAATWLDGGTGQAMVLTTEAEPQSFQAPFLSGEPALLVVSDPDEVGGLWIAGKWGTEEFLLGPNGEVLRFPVDAAVFAFATGEPTLVAADSVTLWEIAAPGDGFGATALEELSAYQSSEEGASSGSRSLRGNRGRTAAAPAGLALNREWAVAALVNGTIVRVARGSGAEPVATDCGCDLTGWAPLRGGVFRLVDTGGAGSALLYEVGRARVWHFQAATAMDTAQIAQGGGQ